MSYNPKDYYMETWKIFTERSVADPAWQIKCIKVLHDLSNDKQETVVEYADFEELKRTIERCELLEAQNFGRSQALYEICRKFGIKTIFELEKIAKEYKDK